jgi:acetyl esterase
MTKSLPAETLPAVGRTAARGIGRTPDAVVNAMTKVGMRVIPRIPDGLKRLLLGGRSITVDGNTLDTTLQLTLAAQRVAGIKGLVASEDVAVARAQLRALAGAFNLDIGGVEVTDLTVAGAAGPIKARHYRPADSRAPLLVYYHGGGWVLGDLDTHDDVCRAISRDAGAHVLSVDYRLAPEHKAPAAAEDAFAAYCWALEHVGELGADPGRVAVGGDSAGGNLAAVVSQQARNAGGRLPALQLLIYPVTNLSGETRSQTLFADGYFLRKWDMDWYTDKYLTDTAIELTDPRVSPLLADDLSGLPPALVLTAGFDPLRDEGNQYAEALRDAGTTVDHREFGSLIHAFLNYFPLGGGSATAATEMTSALRAHLSRA